MVSRRHQDTFSPYRIVGAYLLFGVLWILFSDHAVNLIIDDPALRAVVQTGKGWFYVLITALFLLIFIRRDMHRREETAQGLRHALQEQAVLLREVHHRVKNNLQIITSLINLQKTGRRPSARASEELASIQRRIAAIAQVHQELYQGEELSRISLELLLSTMAGSFPRLRWDISVSPFPLSLDTAVPLSLIISEIAANTENHAYPAESGTGDTVLSFTGQFQEDHFILEVTDEGRGFTPDTAGDTPSAAEDRKGLGHLLISSLAEQLGGSWKVWSRPGSGTTHRLQLPAGLRNAPGPLS